MPTPPQLQLIHIAKHKVGLDDARYRLLLRNVADAGSAKELDNDGVENVMAVMEDMGFKMLNQPPDYWRKKVAARGSTCGDRMAWKIRRWGEMTKYPVEGMCLRMSLGRTDKPQDLTPVEAYNVIEALKKITERDGPVQSGLFEPAPF